MAKSLRLTEVPVYPKFFKADVHQDVSLRVQSFKSLFFSKPQESIDYANQKRSYPYGAYRVDGPTKERVYGHIVPN